MILLLDAHALIWATDDVSQLVPAARSALVDPSNEVLVSAATVWEIEIKRAIGKLSLPGELLDGIEQLGFGVLPVTGADGRDAARLPMHHRDPFDRMLVAQASRLEATVVTRDVAFSAYDVEVLAA